MQKVQSLWTNIFAAGAYLEGGHCVMTGSFDDSGFRRLWPGIVPCQALLMVVSVDLMVSVDYGQGRIQGGRMRSMHPSSRHLYF